MHLLLCIKACSAYNPTYSHIIDKSSLGYSPKRTFIITTTRRKLEI